MRQLWNLKYLVVLISLLTLITVAVVRRSVRPQARGRRAIVYETKDNKEIIMSDSAKSLRIRVTDLRTGKSKTNVSIPLGLANFGMKMAAKFAPKEIEGLDMDQLMAAAKNGEPGKLVEVDDEEKGEHVEVFVE